MATLLMVIDVMDPFKTSNLSRMEKAWLAIRYRTINNGKINAENKGDVNDRASAFRDGPAAGDGICRGHPFPCS
jgi:hypothetical protein